MCVSQQFSPSRICKIEIGHMMKTLKGLPIYYKYIRSSFHARMAQHEIQGVHLVQQSIEKSMMKKA